SGCVLSTGVGRGQTAGGSVKDCATRLPRNFRFFVLQCRRGCASRLSIAPLVVEVAVVALARLAFLLGLGSGPFRLVATETGAVLDRLLRILDSLALFAIPIEINDIAHAAVLRRSTPPVLRRQDPCSPIS